MFQLFLRARMHNLVSRRRDEKGFRVRSSDRDNKSDRARIELIFESIEEAIRSAEIEKSGLIHRVSEATQLASISVGTASDEYLTRESRDTNHLNRLDSEISSGQQRIDRLSESISHYKFLRTAVMTRFPQLRPKEADPTSLPGQKAS